MPGLKETVRYIGGICIGGLIGHTLALSVGLDPELVRVALGTVGGLGSSLWMVR